MFIKSVITAILFFYTGFHGLTVKLNDSTSVNLSQFAGKKILVVDIATGSSLRPQLGSLEQLYQKYKDSLVIIAVPTNDFEREQRDDDAIRAFCTDSFHVHYLLAAKCNVTGPDAAPVFAWLASAALNGITNMPASNNFQKFLIGTDGALIGRFSYTVDPMSAELQDAITGRPHLAR